MQLYYYNSDNVLEHVPNIKGDGVIQHFVVFRKDGIARLNRVLFRLMNNGQNPGSMTVAIHAVNARTGQMGRKALVSVSQYVDVPMDACPGGAVVDFRFNSTFKVPAPGIYAAYLQENGEGGTHNVYGLYSGNPFPNIKSYSVYQGKLFEREGRLVAMEIPTV